MYCSLGKDFDCENSKKTIPKFQPCITFCSDEIFTRIDVDNDGELNVQEFMKGCQEDQVFFFNSF